ncbi:MAG: ROK family protein [Phycisphaerales bacterium]
MKALGIDIGGSSVKAAIVELAASDPHSTPSPRLTAADRGPSYARPDAVALRSALHAAVRAARAQDTGAAASGFDAVGLCVPGVVDESTRRVVVSVNVPGLVGLALPDLAAECAGQPAPDLLEVVSDARAAAHDWWESTARSRAPGSPPRRLLAISLGTGVGACVLDDGRPLRVVGASSGHLGQIDVSLPASPGVPTPIGPDGGRGSLEAYIGLAALRAHVPAHVPIEDAIASLPPGSPPLRALTRAIRIAHALYRPDDIVLLGGVGIRLRHALPALRADIADALTSLARPGWTLQCGSSDFHAAAGAARIALDSARAALDPSRAGLPGDRA